MNKFILFLFLAPLLSFSQGAGLKGRITDNNSLPLPGATITILSLPDSAFISGAITDSVGNFIFNSLTSGKYLVKINYLGYKDRFITKAVQNTMEDLGRITLGESSTTLNQVNVQDKLTPVVQKGDTTQFNADAYKTNKDATTEDLVTKMPGVTMQDGKVQAQGEEVKKVLLDGKPYLGDDASAALKNLPAEVVDKIQVFDKKSDQAEFTGFDDGNSTKTINIVTRPQFRNGTFGRAYAGYGTDDLYKGGLSINFFKDKRKLTLLGNFNNINEQNFAVDDLLGVIGTSSNRGGPPRGNFGPRPGGGGGRFQTQNDAGTFLVDQKGGISETKAGGFNYSNTWKKTDFTASYFYNKSDNNSSNSLSRHYFTSDGAQYNEVNTTISSNTNHRANFKIDHKFDSLNSVLFQPKVSIQTNTSRSTITGINSNNEGVLNQATTGYVSDMDGISFSSPLLYRHSFAKKGRTFSANLNAAYNSNIGNSTLNSITTYAADTIPSDTMDQKSDLNTHGWNYSSELTYTEPVGKFSQLALNYRGNYNMTSSDKSTYTYSPTDNLYNSLDTSLSNKFTTNYLTHSGGINYRYNDSTWNAMIGVAYQSATLDNQRDFPVEGKINRTFPSVLPSAMLQYKFTQRKNLRLFYRSSNNAPSVTQLQDVINNNNPLQLSAGNPNLKQDWNNNLNIRYSSVQPDKNTSFFLFVNGSYTKDYIGNATYIASRDSLVAENIILTTGSQITKPVNTDGYYSLRSFSNYSFPLSFMKSSLNLNMNAGYSRTPSILNYSKNYSKTTTAGLGFALSSNISTKFDFLLSSNGSYNNIANSLQTQSNSKYYSLSSKFRIQVQPYKGFVLQTDITQTTNSGLSTGYNQNYILWNAGFGYKFLKNEVADIRLTVFDILKQNKSVSRTTSDTYYEDSVSNVLGQYFMLTFTYNLKFFKIRS